MFTYIPDTANAADNEVCFDSPFSPTFLSFQFVTNATTEVSPEFISIFVRINLLTLFS